MATKLKSMRDMISSLTGASFRRVSCDGRTWYIREVRTLRHWSRHERPPVNSAAAFAPFNDR